MLQVLSGFLIFLSTFFSPIFALFKKPVPPCSVPIAYEIGTFDRRFNVSEADFLSALKEAEGVWEMPIGKNLFQYDPKKATLPINLIYDYRQQATKELGQIKGVVNQDDATYKYLERQYNALKTEHENLKTAYDAKVAKFQTDNLAYEERLGAWNAGSRTDRNEFNTLEQSRASLEVEFQDVKSTEIQLNNVVNQINVLVVQLNNVAKTLNLNVKQYNTIGAERGETFTGGEYIEDSSGKRIDIYEFENHDKMVRVLAHELGHALGLDHVEDAKAIMYKFNEGETAKPDATDIAALKALCHIN